MNQMTLLLSSALVLICTGLAVDLVLERWPAIVGSSLLGCDQAAGRSGIPARRMRLMLILWTAFSAVVVVCCLLGFEKPMIAIGLAVLLFRLPKWAINHWTEKRIELLRAQMLTMCVSLANVTRSGLSLPQGLSEIVPEIPAPLKSEIIRLNQHIDRGRTPSEAINETRLRLKIDYFDIFASVILTCHETGANYCIALERLGHSIQENQRLERKLKADTAGGRTVVLTLALFPFGFFALFHMMVPENTSAVFNSFYGQVLIVVCGLMTYISVKYAMHIMNIEI